MLRLYFTLGLFFSIPFIWIAAAFWSKPMLLIAAIAAIVGCIWFRATSFTKVLGALQADPLVDDRMSGVLQRVVAQIQKKTQQRIRFRFWVISKSEADSWLWVKGSELNVFFTQGFLARAREDQLFALLDGMRASELRKVKLENRLYALSLRWDGLKGQKNHFRYWFVSFWLYPLERALKIAKIEG